MSFETSFRRTCEFREMAGLGEWKTGLVLQHKLKKGEQTLFARIEVTFFNVTIMVQKLSFLSWIHWNKMRGLNF